MPHGLSLKTRALAHLARREHSRLELEKKLAPHAQNSGELAQLLDDLEECGALSAARMVEQVIHMRKSRFGSQRIVRELRVKGIAENLIAARLPNIKEAEQLSAYEVWRKKFGVMPVNAREFGRQMRFMRSRGFPPETISKVLRGADEEEE
jgi:regulatory protein